MTVHTHTVGARWYGEAGFVSDVPLTELQLCALRPGPTAITPALLHRAASGVRVDLLAAPWWAPWRRRAEKHLTVLSPEYSASTAHAPSAAGRCRLNQVAFHSKVLKVTWAHV